jgi:DNA replication protein DnaC
MASLSEPERRDFWKICEDRYHVRSTILTSQLPVSRWHEQIGDPTLADGILDRLVHNAHQIEMKGGIHAEESGEAALVERLRYCTEDTRWFSRPSHLFTMKSFANHTLSER